MQPRAKNPATAGNNNNNSNNNSNNSNHPQHEIVSVDNDKDHPKGRLPHHQPQMLKASLVRSPLSHLRTVALVSLIVFSVYFLVDTSNTNHMSNSPFSRPSSQVKVLNEITTGSRADWEAEQPLFCKRLIENPRPQEYACKRNPDFSCADTGDTIMFSQFKQDYYLYTQHFVNLNRPGVYLDVAANDPFHYSNTYFQDRCLKWRGICVEGNPSYHEKLYRHRSCHLVPTCVGASDGEYVAFGLNGGSGGIIGKSFKNAEVLARQNKTVATIRERCTTMGQVLSRTNVKHADYLSLDVEGHEMAVLKGFDWDSVVINVISVETSKESLEPITDFLTDKGYVKHHPQLDERSIRSGMIHEDAIFLHKDVVWGSPV